jgi:predicted ATPase/DNA-binding SARP family transcriptional activator
MVTCQEVLSPFRPSCPTCHDGGVTALGVLGPLLLEGEAGPVRIGSARQRRLLAALAAHLGRPVHVDRLVDLVWADDPPADPAGAVQTNVARLRRLLPGGIRLVTTPEGYRLDADRAIVDVTAFADHLAAAAALDDPAARRDRLSAALVLWRGWPYPELDHPALAPEITRLAELRAGATEQHAEALLEGGRVGEAVAEIEALVAAEPLRECAVGVLMRALVAAGRQGDALAAFARLRSRLADELGLDPSPPLRELERRVLRQDLVVPSASVASPGRPPPRPRLPISSFVGRDGAVTYVDGLLARHRIVTLCGPGGVGKTRLALHVAAAAAGRDDDGVLVVEFGEGGPGDVAAIVAAALRMADAGRTGGAAAFADRVVALLALRRRLLVLDNCEHVADEVAGLVEAICSGAPGVDLLVTSREPLRVDGERVVGVDPLGPDDAAALLVDRMRAAEPNPDGPDRLTPELVAEACRRLDGLPLALELAAPRAVVLGLDGLLHELDAPFPVLRGGRRAAARRHRSLRDVVEWSYGLLDDAQRALFERLSVFAGPVEPAAVDAVCGDAAALPDLVDRSLVVRRAGDTPTFGMLETLRAFGRTRLATDPSGLRLRARHATWAAGLAEEVAAARRGPGEVVALRRFDAHVPDLRRAHSWLCAHGPLDELLRLTVPIAELSYLRGRADLVLMLEETLRAACVLEPGSPVPTHPLLARLLGYHAHTLWQRGELDASECQALRALGVAAAAGEPAAARDGHEALANVHGFRGDLDAGRHHGRVALDLAVAADDADVAVLALTDLAIQSAYAGDHDASRRSEARLAELVGRTGSVTGRAFLAYTRGECRTERGDPEAARYLDEAVRVAEEAGLWFAAGIARHTLLTSAARVATDPAQALSSFGPLLHHWHGFGSWTQLWMALRALLETLSRLGRHREAAVLLGALRASPRAPRVFGADSARLQAVEVAARAALGAGFDACHAEGAALGDAEAFALAHGLARATPLPPDHRDRGVEPVPDRGAPA